MKPISFIATTDPAATNKFYGTIIGLDLVEESPYALAFQDGDHMLRIQIVPDLPPATFTSHGWEVEDIEAGIQRLTSKGVAFEQFENLQQDALGVWTTPDGNKIAWFKDPSGNILSLTQYVAKAEV